MSDVRNADTLIIFVDTFTKSDRNYVYCFLDCTVCDILFCAVSDSHENMKLNNNIGRFHIFVS